MEMHQLLHSFCQCAISLSLTIANHDNYLEFLNDILKKYGLQTQYKATSKHSFPVKIHIPPEKYNFCFFSTLFSLTMFPDWRRLLMSKILKNWVVLWGPRYMDNIWLWCHMLMTFVEGQVTEGDDEDDDDEETEVCNCSVFYSMLLCITCMVQCV